MPSGKLIRSGTRQCTTFTLRQSNYSKIFFVLKHLRQAESLAKYYIDKYGYLIPDDVEFWEYCTDEHGGNRVNQVSTLELDVGDLKPRAVEFTADGTHRHAEGRPQDRNAAGAVSAPAERVGGAARKVWAHGDGRSLASDRRRFEHRRYAERAARQIAAGRISLVCAGDAARKDGGDAGVQTR